jgi:hypothetical protein
MGEDSEIFPRSDTCAAALSTGGEPEVPWIPSQGRGTYPNKHVLTHRQTYVTTQYGASPSGNGCSLGRLTPQEGNSRLIW